MGLIKSEIRNGARILLNEIIEGFWLNSQLETWVDIAAIDISTKTNSYAQTVDITLKTDIQTYDVADNYLKVLGAIYNHQGLKKTTPWMEGLQTAVQVGSPEYYFDIVEQVGFFPVPTTTDNNKLIKVYYAAVTNDIRNIQLKFKLAAILFVTSMGLMKERQYAKAGQAYQVYAQSLNIDLLNVQRENIDTPPSTDKYTLKVFEPKQ